MNKTFRNAIALIALLLPAAVSAQLSPINFATTVKGPDERPESVIEKMNRHDIFNSLEIAANIGSTGLGLELASPMTKWTKLRVGFDWMPPFTIPMAFNMDSYIDGEVNHKFGTIQKLMYDMSGTTMDKEILMESKATMNTFRLLVDVYPFKDTHWHVTAGFFIGGNTMGKSVNKMSEMPSLLALNMYDRLYNIYSSDDYMDYVVDTPIIGDIYLSPEVGIELHEKFLELGQLGVHVGDFKDGTPYMMMPDEDGTVSAKAKVNTFRPYLGFGYGGNLTPDGKWQVSIDAGMQFWGGAPKVTTHDGTVLNDLKHLRGKVGNYMNLMRAIPVYPTIDFRIAYRF